MRKPSKTLHLLYFPHHAQGVDGGPTWKVTKVVGSLVVAPGEFLTKAKVNGFLDSKDWTVTITEGKSP